MRPVLWLLFFAFRTFVLASEKLNVYKFNYFEQLKFSAQMLSSSSSEQTKQQKSLVLKNSNWSKI